MSELPKIVIKDNKWKFEGQEVWYDLEEDLKTSESCTLRKNNLVFSPFPMNGARFDKI